MSLKTAYRIASCAAAVAVVALTTIPTADAAQRRRSAPLPAVDGLAAMHDMRREGNRLCFSDHFHYGSSTAQRNVKAAQAAAIRSWADFVIFEYDPSWANFAKSASKDMKCSQGATGWACDVSSRPCR